jgi:hypothetical protein
MLFRTFEPYTHDYVNQNTLCFICYETKTDDEIQSIALNLHEHYIKICNCNGFAHNKCLKKWYDISNKCPICRKNVYKRITFPMIIIKKGEYFYFVFCINFCKNISKNISKLIRVLFVCFFIYYSIYIFTI